MTKFFPENVGFEQEGTGTEEASLLIRNRSDLEIAFRRVTDRATKGSRIKIDKLLEGIFGILECKGYAGLSDDLETLLKRQGFVRLVPLLRRSNDKAG